MKLLAKLIRNEIFSISTIIFVVVPFALSLQNPQTSKNPVEMLQVNISAAIDSIPVEDIEYAIKKQTSSMLKAVNIGGTSGGPYKFSNKSSYSRSSANIKPVRFNS
jgi:hypothetical protein